VNRHLIQEAAERIAGRVRRTPVMGVDLDGVEVVAKLELLQHTGSFKPRGAFNRVLAADSIPEAGLITASGGNHGAAVAFVAHQLGLTAEVFVAEVTPALKRERIAAFGAQVVIGGRQYPDALDTSHERAAVTGALEIHAYDHELTVAGQGTMAIELQEQVPDLDTVIISVGGGGFAAGVAAWFEGRAKVVCVEPQGSRALNAAIEAGCPVDVEIDSVASDSLGARRIGVVPFQVLHDSESVLVTDRAIVDAQRWLWDRMRLVVEPGGAAATAAVLSGAYRPHHGERVVVAICGSNTDPAMVI
jgi:threonine dehydratase